MTRPATEPATGWPAAVASEASVDLRVHLGDLTLDNPVMVAAGCAGTGRELSGFVPLEQLGALVTRSVTLDPRAGGAPPRVLETTGGLLHDADPQGPGLQGFLATELPWLAQQGARTVVSLAGSSLGEWNELARRVGLSPGVSAVEVNLAFPDPAQARDAFLVGKVVAAVRRDLPGGLPVLAKVAADPWTVLDVAAAAAKAGADAVVVGHGPPGLALDERTLRPALGATAALLSGPALLTLTLRCVWDVKAALPDLPVVGCGGVRTGRDAVAVLAAGAVAVQVGSSVLHDPLAPLRVRDGLREEVARRGLGSVSQASGVGHHAGGDRR